MKTILLIISLILLHYPLGVFKDTIRRYSRMKSYNKEEDYEIKNGIVPYENGNPILNFEGFYLALLGALILAIFPAIKLFDYNWFFIVLGNVLVPVLISPAIAFITTKPMSIKNRNQISKLTYLSISIGFVLYILTTFL